jgi:hypothetical protein
MEPSCSIVAQGRMKIPLFPPLEKWEERRSLSVGFDRGIFE